MVAEDGIFTNLTFSAAGLLGAAADSFETGSVVPAVDVGFRAISPNNPEDDLTGLSEITEVLLLTPKKRFARLLA